jgi:TetR/AcrR family acrAB operon transcriptional repressor
MARRTKQDALATRDSILDAAELLFEQQGVSRTTLQHIAAAAGVTRGAIYWHFEDKSALFNAMMERATMPLETVAQCQNGGDVPDPIGDVRAWLLTAFRLTATDPKTRRVFEIATHKVEYVDELIGVRDRHLANYTQWLVRAESRLKIAIKRGLVKHNVSARVTALGLWAATDGLIRIWLLNPTAFNLMRVGRQIIDAHIDSLLVTPGTRAVKSVSKSASAARSDKSARVGPSGK